MTELHLITSAAAFAADAHINQVRKELNEPYIVHPIRVAQMAALAGQEADFVAACFLHDVVEDTAIPLSTIASMFPPTTVALVDAMTKWWRSGMHDLDSERVWSQQYVQRLLRVPRAPMLKVLDRIDNLRDFTRMARMAPTTHRWASNYYIKTRDGFGELLKAVPDPFVVAEFTLALSELEAATRRQQVPQTGSYRPL